MRTLKFPADSIEYTLLHRATITSQMKPSPAQFQKIADIQIRLEDIGKPILAEGEEADKNGIYFYTIEKDGMVVFEEAEFSMLQSLFNETQFPINLARFVANTKKMLDEAKEEKPVAKLKKL